MKPLLTIIQLNSLFALNYKTRFDYKNAIQMFGDISDILDIISIFYSTRDFITCLLQYIHSVTKFSSISTQHARSYGSYTRLDERSSATKRY